MTTTVDHDALAQPKRRETALVEVAETRDYVRAAKARATLRAYQSDWRNFSGGCERQGLKDLPADPATARRMPIDQLIVTNGLIQIKRARKNGQISLTWPDSLADDFVESFMGKN